MKFKGVAASRARERVLAVMAARMSLKKGSGPSIRCQDMTILDKPSMPMTRAVALTGHDEVTADVENVSGKTWLAISKHVDRKGYLIGCNMDGPEMSGLVDAAR